MVQATPQVNDTTTGPSGPMRWPSSHYELAGHPGTGRSVDRLAVCVAHGGQHVYYVDPRSGEGWCQDLGRPARPHVARLLMQTFHGRSMVAGHFDEEKFGRAIADGLVEGLRRARAEQRAEQRGRWR